MSDFSIDGIERDLAEQWNHYKAEPKEIAIGTSFGLVWLNAGGLFLDVADENGESVGVRPLTTDEAEQFKKEFPQLCK